MSDTLSPRDDGPPAAFRLTEGNQLMGHVRVNGVHDPAIDWYRHCSCGDRLPANRGVHVSLTKRLPLLVALVAVLSLGSSLQVEAQGRRGGRGRSVVVVNRGYYWADPFWYQATATRSTRTTSFRLAGIPIPATTATTLAAQFAWK